jgi:O-antigen/teichoic acid export membrane protein
VAVRSLAYPLLQYWVSPKYAEEGAVALVLFALAGAVNATTMSASYINLAAVHPGMNLTFSLANSAISLATVYPLTAAMGVTGAALAGLLGAITVPAFFWYAHKRVIHLSSLYVFRSCYLATIAGAGIVGVATFLVVGPRLSNLLVTLVAFALVTLLSMGVSGAFGAIKREDLETGMSLLRAIRLSRRAPSENGVD